MKKLVKWARSKIKGEPTVLIGAGYGVVLGALNLLAPGTVHVADVAGPVLALLHIRARVYSPATVKRLTDSARRRVEAAEGRKAG